MSFLESLALKHPLGTIAPSASWRLPMLVGLVLLQTTGMSDAQSIYKCDIDGRVTYSQVPCKTGQPETLKVAPGPSAAEAAAAKIRAQSQKARADSIRPSSPAEAPTVVRNLTPSCEQYEQRRLDAIVRRNQALGAARQGVGVGPNVSRNQDVGALQRDAAALEAEMRAQGCTPGP